MQRGGAGAAEGDGGLDSQGGGHLVHLHRFNFCTLLYSIAIVCRVLAEGFNTFLGNVLHRAEWPSEARVAMLRLLSFGAEQVESNHQTLI